MMGLIIVLLRTPATVDLEPPKYADTHDVLVEEIDNPEGKRGERDTHAQIHQTHMFPFLEYDQCPWTNSNLLRNRNCAIA